MKKILFALLMGSLVACGTKNDQQRIGAAAKSEEATKTSAGDNAAKSKVFCYEGLMNNKIPVLVAFSLEDSLLHGQIIYLNTKQRQPIILLGDYDGGDKYYLMEYGKTGNVSGLLSVSMEGNKLNGKWYSPMTQKEYSLSLQAKDTAYLLPDITYNPQAIKGNYRQQFSEDGPSGEFDIEEVSGDQLAFSASCVTAAPAYNIADVPKANVTRKGNRFIYHIPGSDSCDFMVRLYNGFLRVTYVHGYSPCESQFGHNATVEGIFLKVD